jgi:hypothetical protein
VEPKLFFRFRAGKFSSAAPIDALLADIKAIMNNAPALPKTTSPKPPAMLSPSPRPTSSYLGAVLNTNGGGHASSAPPSPTALAPPLPTVVKGQPLRVCQRTQPHHRTGHCNRPRAPSPPNKVPPSHPYSMQGGLPTPTTTMLAQATSPCCSAVLSSTPSLMTPPTPSLLPSVFSGEVLLFLGGGTAHPLGVLVARIHHHRSAHNASTDLVVLANIMAPGLLIHRSTFFVGGDIGPMHLTNLLQMDGLKMGRGNLLA